MSTIAADKPVVLVVDDSADVRAGLEAHPHGGTGHEGRCHIVPDEAPSVNKSCSTPFMPGLKRIASGSTTSRSRRFVTYRRLAAREREIFLLVTAGLLKRQID